MAEIDAIANNRKPATFENTIVAMERSGQLLGRVRAVFYTLTGSYTNDTLQALDKDLAPKFAAHSDAIRLNPKLKAILDAEANNLGVYGGMGEVAARILAEYFKRPDLAAVPRQRAGRKPKK